MSNPLWSADRCAQCGKRRGHEVHEIARRPRWWRRLLRLAWPTWVRPNLAGHHLFVNQATRIAATDAMAQLKRRVERARRRRA